MVSDQDLNNHMRQREGICSGTRQDGLSACVLSCYLRLLHLWVDKLEGKLHKEVKYIDKRYLYTYTKCVKWKVRGL